MSYQTHIVITSSLALFVGVNKFSQMALSAFAFPSYINRNLSIKYCKPTSMSSTRSTTCIVRVLFHLLLIDYYMKLHTMEKTSY